MDYAEQGELRDSLVLFQRVYDRCECLGWDERFEGRGIRWGVGGGILTAEPNGETIVGRSNHKRGCARERGRG